MSTDTELDNDVNTSTGEPIVAHYVVSPDGKQSARAAITEALVNGTPLKALCGHVWIPSRDPKKYPLCQKCKEIHEMLRNIME